MPFLSSYSQNTQSNPPPHNQFNKQKPTKQARALYSDADIVLMDDVLSAVDAPVAEHMYREAVVGFLKGRTRWVVG